MLNYVEMCSSNWSIQRIRNSFVDLLLILALLNNRITYIRLIGRVSILTPLLPITNLTPISKSNYTSKMSAMIANPRDH